MRSFSFVRLGSRDASSRVRAGSIDGLHVCLRPLTVFAILHLVASCSLTAGPLDPGDLPECGVIEFDGKRSGAVSADRSAGRCEPHFVLNEAKLLHTAAGVWETDLRTGERLRFGSSDSGVVLDARGEDALWREYWPASGPLFVSFGHTEGQLVTDLSGSRGAACSGRYLSGYGELLYAEGADVLILRPGSAAESIAKIDDAEEVGLDVEGGLRAIYAVKDGRVSVWAHSDKAGLVGVASDIALLGRGWARVAGSHVFWGAGVSVGIWSVADSSFGTLEDCRGPPLAVGFGRVAFECVNGLRIYEGRTLRRVFSLDRAWTAAALGPNDVVWTHAKQSECPSLPAPVYAASLQYESTAVEVGQILPLCGEPNDMSPELAASDTFFAWNQGLGEGAGGRVNDIVYHSIPNRYPCEAAK